MKYHLPQGCVRLSHAGKSVAIAADGSIDLDASVATLLAPHGIVPVGDPVPIDPDQIATLSASDLVAALAARGVPVPKQASLATLRGLLRQAIAKPGR